MADLVAWSPIQSAKNNGTDSDPDMEEVTIAPGESVSQDALGLDDDGWEQLKGSSAVRSMAYPDMPDTFQGSPVEFLREQAKLAADDAMAEVEASEENMAAIAAINAASTGVALLPEVEEGTGPSDDATPAEPKAAKAGDNK